MNHDIDRRTALRYTLAAQMPVMASRAMAGSDVDWLVTPEEVASAKAAPATAVLSPKTVGAPQIEVIKPGAGEMPLRSPMPIELVFRSASDSAIDTATFRIFYGALQLDVTQRLLKSVAVRADRLSVERALIPPGSHRLVLQIADTRQRTGQREMRFTVLAPEPVTSR